MDIATAQWRLQRLGDLNRLDIRLKPHAQRNRVVASIQRLLPPGVHASAVESLEQASAWLDGLGDRFPNAPPGLDPSRDELAELRAAVRAALQATVGGKAHDRAVLDALNRAAARALTSPAARWRDGRAEAATDFHGASRADGKAGVGGDA